MVTLRAELWAEAPAASVAATVNMYVVPAVSPVTLKLGVVEVPMEVPFW